MLSSRSGAVELLTHWLTFLHPLESSPRVEYGLVIFIYKKHSSLLSSQSSLDGKHRTLGQVGYSVSVVFQIYCLSQWAWKIFFNSVKERRFFYYDVLWYCSQYNMIVQTLYYTCIIIQ